MEEACQLQEEIVSSEEIHLEEVPAVVSEEKEAESLSNATYDT